MGLLSLYMGKVTRVRKKLASSAVFLKLLRPLVFSDPTYAEKDEGSTRAGDSQRITGRGQNLLATLNTVLIQIQGYDDWRSEGGQSPLILIRKVGRLWNFVGRFWKFWKVRRFWKI